MALNAARVGDPRVPRRVADHLSDPRHAGAVAGATRVGESCDERRLVVRIGLWIDVRGHVVRARFQATTCAALIAYADAACALLEAGEDPHRLDEAGVRASVAGVHPVHHDRAALVARAIARAGAPGGLEQGASA